MRISSSRFSTLFYSISKRILAVEMEKKIGNSQEKEIQSFSWKRQRVKKIATVNKSVT